MTSPTFVDSETYARAILTQMKHKLLYAAVLSDTHPIMYIKTVKVIKVIKVIIGKKCH
jgi:hypothetical protein